MQCLQTRDLSAFWHIWSKTLLGAMQSLATAHGAPATKQTRGMRVVELSAAEVWAKRFHQEPEGTVTELCRAGKRDSAQAGRLGL
eukprot:4346700-Alexandrium_andersonii.AAC.1